MKTEQRKVSVESIQLAKTSNVAKINYLIILALLISFASVGAVVFTPGLPNIADYFGITNKVIINS